MDKKTRVLITGGAGFIGSHIAEHFQGKAEVRVYDNLRSGFRRNLDGFGVEFIEADILDRASLREAMDGVDYVFHLAAMISVPESMEKIIDCIKLNAEGTVTVLEEAARAGAKKLCLSTSAAIYGNNPTVPKREAMNPEPFSPYAVTKLDGEYYCNMFAETGRLNTACLRYFNVFGPRQNPKSAYAAAVPIFTAKMIADEPVTIYGDGEQTRDFIYVKDIAAANAFFAQNEFSGVYNIAYGRCITINALVDKIRQLTGSKSEVIYAPARAGDVKHSMAAIDKLRSTGFSITDRFDEGLAATVRYFAALGK